MRPGGNAGGRPSRSRRATAGRTWRVWPEPLRRALQEPRRPHPALEPPRSQGRREPRMPGCQRPPREQPRRRQHQQFERALDVRRPLRQQPRRARAARTHPPSPPRSGGRRRRQTPLHRQPRLRGVELGRGAVQHDRQVPELYLQQPLEPPAGVLELRQHAPHVRPVALVMAGDERLRCGLDPDRPSVARPRPSRMSRADRYAYASAPSGCTIAAISSEARSNSSSESTGVPSNGRSRVISSHERHPP